MATLTELHDLFSNDDLQVKIRSALLISVYTIISGTPTAADRTYAAKVFRDPKTEAERVIKYVLAANAAQDVATILAATDATIQGQVDAAVPILVLADAGT